MSTYDWENSSDEIYLLDLLHERKRDRNNWEQQICKLGSFAPGEVLTQINNIDEEISYLKKRIDKLQGGLAKCTCYIGHMAEDLSKEHTKFIISSLDRLQMDIINIYYADNETIEHDLEKLKQADIFIGAWGIIYGPSLSDEDDRSISHIEYDFAVENNITCYLYISAEEHSFNTSLMKKSRHKEENLEQLKKSIAASIVPWKMFETPEHLSNHINSDIRDHALKRKANTLSSHKVKTLTVNSSSNKQLSNLPPLYLPRYILSNRFQGRIKELNKINEWYESSNALMIIEAFGGQGKSALAWEWLHNGRPNEVKAAGIIWWSFYGEQATVPNFVRRAYAYITQQDPAAEQLERLNLNTILEQLIIELNKQHYILVLDGFERMLAAYWRLERAHMEDAQIPDSLEERECISAFDSNFLQHLSHLSNSKVILTTRLYPAALESLEQTQSFNTAYHIRLQGMAPGDALALAESYRLQINNKQAFLNFLSQINFHALVMNIVFKNIVNYRKSPRGFDAWYEEHQHNTAWEQISGPEQVKATLQEISTNLSNHAQNILQRIAIFNEPVDFDTLLTLYMPKYKPPQNLPKRIRLSPHPFGTIEEREIRKKLAQAENPEDRAWYTQQLEQLETKIEQQDQELLRNRPQLELQAQAINQERKRLKQEHYHTYLNSPTYTQAYNELDRALRELEHQGFLDWNREDNSYDLHPLIRTYVQKSLPPDLYEHHSEEILDRVNIIPFSEQQHVSLSQLKNFFLLYQWLLRNKKYDEAALVYTARLGQHLYRHSQWRRVIELLQPLFKQGPDQPPVSQVSQTYLINQYGIALTGLGRYEEAAKVLKQDILLEDRANTWLALANYADALIGINQLYLAHEIYLQARSFYDQANQAWDILHQCELAFIVGDISSVTMLLADLKQAQAPQNSPQAWKARLSLLQIKFAFHNQQDPSRFFNTELLHRNPVNYHYYKALYAYKQDQDLETILHDLHQAISQAVQEQLPSKHLYSLLALINLKQGHQRQAIATIEQALKQPEGSSGLQIICLLDAGILYSQLNKTDKALHYIQQAYSLAWADGGDYSHRLQLEQAKNILKQHGQKIPTPAEKRPAHQLPIEEITQKHQEYLATNTAEPEPQEVIFNSIHWLQIGTIATFGIKEQLLIQAMAEKFTLLSSEPSPLVYSHMGEETPPAPTEPLQDEQISLEQLIFTYQDTKLLDKIFIIMYLEGKDQHNQAQFAYVNVRADRIATIISAYEDQTSIELHNASTLIMHGSGRPNQEERQKLIKDYLFGEHYVNVRIFPDTVDKFHNPANPNSTSEHQTNHTPFVFSNVTDFDIGCIAVFSLPEQQQFESTVQKLTLLSYKPRSLVFSFDGEDVPPSPIIAPLYLTKSKQYNEIDWSTKDHSIFKHIFIIALVQGTNQQGQQQYAAINIRADRLNVLMNHLQQATPFNTFNLSTPIFQGIGALTSSEREKLQKDYRYSYTAVNIRIFPENLEKYT